MALCVVIRAARSKMTIALVVTAFPAFASFLCAQDSTTPAADDVFRSTIRPTDPLSPEEELKSFTVPDGFEVSLFASEPQIQKPLNMAFDADGRLWVTGSNEYPFPAKEGEGKDSIRILEDTNGDGSADKVTVFADDLNIPIGLYPWKDGVIAFTIPNIVFLRDTDGDGRADSREVLYGPFDTTRDTHGMNNAFRRGFDGWLYCCHGFNNQSKVAGRDGHTVLMSSGNTYRIRLDGSRIEHFTHGQVNPFGMTIDANGDLFTSDCHTKPVTLLIRDGTYESFGKPHDGLGFVPPVMDHLHGSTAIDAVCQYQGTSFPEDYRDDLFIGNVMTCRVHRNSIVRNGASIRMKTEDDFLESSDPWFRPVDIQMGPDGALYVADFYNRIIGHYEVPLDHPGRDRERGRIWKIRYTGDEASGVTEISKLVTAELPALLQALRHPQKPIRQHAADQIVDRVGQQAATSVRSELLRSISGNDQVDAPQLLWVLQRLEALKLATLENAWQNGNERTRIHVMRICSERAEKQDQLTLLRSGLRDPAAIVQRAAADAAGRAPAVAVAKEVVNGLVVCPARDVHLKHALKIALRNQLLDSEVASWFAASTPPAVACAALAEVLPAVKTPTGGDLAVTLLKSGNLSPVQKESVARHAASHASGVSAIALLRIARNLPADQSKLKTEIWLALAEGFENRDSDPPQAFQEWSSQLANEILAETDVAKLSWGQYSLDGRPPVTWKLEQRQPSTELKQKIPFLSSLPGGERSVGVLRSRPFVLSFTLEVQVCGHLGPPARGPQPDNQVLLRDYATGKIIRSALAPRNDVATTLNWDNTGYAGRKAYLEVVDGLALRSFAWIAVGRILPIVVEADKPPGDGKQLLAAVTILAKQARSGKPLSSSQMETLNELTTSLQVNGNIRTAAARALLLHHNRTDAIALADLLQIGTTPRVVDVAITRFCTTDFDKTSPKNGFEVSGRTESIAELSERLLLGVFSRIDANLRKRLAGKLAESAGGAGLLVKAMEVGVPSAELLRDQRLAEQLSGYDSAIADRVKKLVANLPPESTDSKELTARIIRQIKLGQGDAGKGRAIYEKHCAACHKRGGEGGAAGPQLDGIGTRGVARLLEDILQPNRNVDVAFRTSVLQLKSGKTVTGIIRKTNDDYTLTVLNTEGKAQAVPVSQVEERKDLNISLMPGNVATQLKENELRDLTRFLLK